jgi:hypothetical protein
MTHWTQVVGFLKGKEETEAPAALKHLDIGRLYDVIAVFTQFIKSAQGNSVSYFSTFSIVQKLIHNLRPLRPGKYSETLMKAVSKRF